MGVYFKKKSGTTRGNACGVSVYICVCMREREVEREGVAMTPRMYSQIFHLTTNTNTNTNNNKSNQQQANNVRTTTEMTIPTDQA